jgi:hypothetical protein
VQMSPGASITFTPAAQAAAATMLTIVGSTGTQTLSITGEGVRSLVPHYYTSILGRDADPGGAVFWNNEAARVQALGAELNEAWFAMAQAFFGSTEYSSLVRAPDDYLRDLYRTFFNRDPDAGGLAYWRGELNAGMPREVVLVSFMFSPEFAAFTRGLFGESAVRSEISTVVDFYRGMLGRLPDDSGFRYWLARFRAAQCAGPAALYAEVEAISTAFLSGDEYQARSRTNAQFVADMYNAFMRRGGDLAGVAYWIVQVASGARTREDVRRAFVTTPEFAQRVAAMLSEGCRP